MVLKLFKFLKLCAFVPLCLCAFFSSPALSQDLLSDVPPDHWARKAIQTLRENGILSSYPDETFRGNQVVTRYEVAASLARLVEKLDLDVKKESLTKEDIEVLKKLLKEFKPDMTKDIQKIQTKLQEAEKNLKAKEKTLKSLEKTGPEIENYVKKETKPLKQEMQAIQQSQGNFVLSGSSSWAISTTDYKAKEIRDQTTFDMAGNGKNNIGMAPPSSLSTSMGFSFSLTTKPRVLTKTNRTVQVGTSFGTSLNLGKDANGNVEEPALSLSSFSVDYSAPMEQFRVVKGGNNSAGWTFLSVPLLGMNFDGLKIQTSRGNYTMEGIFFRREVSKAAALQKDLPLNIFAEYVRGLRISTSYKKTNKIGLNYLFVKQDTDSFFVPLSDITKGPPQEPANPSSVASMLLPTEKIPLKYRPAENTLVTIDTTYQLAPAIQLQAEYALSNFKQYLFPSSLCTDNNNDKICKPADDTFHLVRGKIPYEKANDSAYLLLMSYGLPKIGLQVNPLYVKQNPNFHSRIGGITSLLSAAGGGSLNVGGFDIGSILQGLEVGGFLLIAYNPPAIKGLKLGFTAAVQGGETQPSKLSTLPQQFGITSVQLDKDADRRTKLLKLRALLPEITYNPKQEISISISMVHVLAGFDDEVIEGVEGSVFNRSVNNPDFGSSCVPCRTRPFFIYDSLDLGGAQQTVVLDGERLLFCTNADCSTFTAQNINVLAGQSVFLNVKEQTTECNFQGVNYSCEGNYLLYRDDTDPQNVKFQMRKITPKMLGLNVKVVIPTIKLTYKFNPKLNYAVEWSQQKIKFKRLILPPSAEEGVGALKTLAEQVGLKTEYVTKLNNSFSYQLYRSVDLEFNFNIEKRRFLFRKHDISPFFLPPLDGHTEWRYSTSFKAKISF